MPDLLGVFEFAAKTVRSISREFRVAWVSGVEAARRDALVEFEEENEFLEPQSADFDDEPPHYHWRDGEGFDLLPCRCRTNNPPPTPLLWCSCNHPRANHHNRTGFCNLSTCDCNHFALLAPAASTTAVEDPSVGVPPAPTEADSNDRFMTDAEFQTALAAEKRKWAGLAERLRTYDGPVANLPIPTITDVLAEHYLESHSDRRIVGCRCGLELGSRQQHWDHQADLIAGALKARTQAAEK